MPHLAWAVLAALVTGMPCCCASMHVRATATIMASRGTDLPKLLTRKGGAARAVDMGAPGLQFPRDRTWSWEKPPPKSSLSKDLPKPQAQNAGTRTLNIIEFVHWASFPLGFWVVHYIHQHASQIASKLPKLPSTAALTHSTRIYLIMLGLLCQIFGGGISGNMMHEYEGWQVCPFRNPLALPAAKPSAAEVDETRVDNFNNAWLRGVAYQFLFSFQSLGLALFSTAVHGLNVFTYVLLGVTVAVALLGPRRPFYPFYRSIDGLPRPVLPLPVSLIVVFAVNLLVNVYAYRKFFGEGFVAKWLSECPSLPAWAKELLKWVISAIPATVVGMGGAIEGGIAEATFNQWWHFTAFIILLAGLYLHQVAYSLLVNN